MSMIVAFLQLTGYFLCLVLFFPVYRPKKNHLRRIVKSILTLLTIACFLFAYTEDKILLFPKEGFVEYTCLTFFSLCFLWFCEIEAILEKRSAGLISYGFLGMFFWLTLLTSLKFIPILRYAFFPLFGTLIAAPVLMLAVTIYEIHAVSQRHPHLRLWQSLLLGLIFLGIFILLGNLIPGFEFNPLSFFTLHYPFP